jgi:hypothetical protein
MSQIPINILEEYLNNGKLKRNKHPDYDLYIWNYTESSQYHKQWDDITLICRALVTDFAGNIVAKSFPKFFNYEEIGEDYVHLDADINTDEYTLYEKIDGSLCLLFNYNGEWIFCSRGSFSSEQAIIGKKILDKYVYYNKLDKSITYNFEIIYPENRIVVNYNGLENIIFLAAFKGIEEVELDEGYIKSLGLEKCLTYHEKTLQTVLGENIKNMEGYILKFKRTGERIKIKYENYKRLHKQMSNISLKSVFEAIKNETEIISHIPDEYHDWFRKIDELVNTKYDKIVRDATEIYHRNYNYENKKFAKNIKHLDIKNLLFQYRKLSYFPRHLVFNMIEKSDSFKDFYNIS